MVETWTIAELAEAVGTMLHGDSQERGAADGRVREAPNERSIRWYTTIGLLDPPLSRRGRTARYGRRHLLQLLAVKRRQAEGRTLAEIQAELVGATDTTLERIAHPDGSGAAPAATTPEAPAPTGPQVPDPPVGPGGDDAAGAPAPPTRFWATDHRESRATAAASPATDPGRTLTGLTLAPGAALLLDSSPRALSASDSRALAAAAAELLCVARERGLVPPADHAHEGGAAP